MMMARGTQNVEITRYKQLLALHQQYTKFAKVSDEEILKSNLLNAIKCKLYNQGYLLRVIIKALELRKKQLPTSLSDSDSDVSSTEIKETTSNSMVWKVNLGGTMKENLIPLLYNRPILLQKKPESPFKTKEGTYDIRTWMKKNS